MLGGLGICGRPFCCNRFLNDFLPVSIKMAKEQGLSLNPVKISGTCGRLMCCLNYEQNVYEKLNKTTPKVGASVSTPDGEGVVISASVLGQKVKVRLESRDSLETYSCDEIQVIKGKKKPDEKGEKKPEDKDENTQN